MDDLSIKGNTIDNYKRLISSSKAFIEYLETFGLENKIEEECDLDCLKVGYATFALLMWKDEYIRKDKAKNLSTILVDNMLEMYINMVATKNADGKWQLGNIVFDNNLEVVDKIRNKLAHGDYIIANHNVYFDIEGQRGALTTDQLMNFAVRLGNDWEKMKQYGANYNDIFRNANLLEGLSIQNEEDLNKAIEKISHIEIIDMPQILKARTIPYMQIAQHLKQAVAEEVQNNRPVERIPYMPEAQKLFNSVGMNVSIKEEPVTRLPKIDKVREMYLSKMNQLKQVDPYSQQRYLTHWIHEACRQEMAKKTICNGLLSNQVYLQELAKNPNIDIASILSASPYGDTLSMLNENAIMASYISSFYFTYIYGLDDILNIVNREYLPDIVMGKTFDFSKLDLSAVNPKNMIIEHEYPEFREQITRMRVEVLDLESREAKLGKNYINIYKVPGKESTAKTLEALLKIVRKEKKKKKELIRRCEYFMQYKYEAYKYNRAVIEHIRNSIAHGNVYLDIFRGNYTTDDAVIKFQDIHEDENSFELELTTKEFNSLMNDTNLGQIDQFLGDESSEITAMFHQLSLFSDDDLKQTGMKM
ncbi:MAG: hypothetical protein IKQ06_04380 [Bacilli bacterium]|nr:hypothetical protein [Bacilli bacterium]